MFLTIFPFKASKYILSLQMVMFYLSRKSDIILSFKLLKHFKMFTTFWPIWKCCLLIMVCVLIKENVFVFGLDNRIKGDETEIIVCVALIRWLVPFAVTSRRACVYISIKLTSTNNKITVIYRHQPPLRDKNNIIIHDFSFSMYKLSDMCLPL